LFTIGILAEAALTLVWVNSPKIFIRVEPTDFVPVGQLAGSRYPGGLYSPGLTTDQPNASQILAGLKPPGLGAAAQDAPLSQVVWFGLSDPPMISKGAGRESFVGVGVGVGEGLGSVGVGAGVGAAGSVGLGGNG